jgi:hypothetical protein
MGDNRESFYPVCPGSISGNMTEECKSACQSCSMCSANKWEYTPGCPECMECLERNEVVIE